MKNIYKPIIITLTILFLSSCSVDKFSPEGILTEETLIVDEATAQVALNGIYAATRANANGIENLMMALALSGAEQKPGEFANASFNTFFENNVKPTPIDGRGGTLFTFYVKSYSLINLANFFITKVEKGVPSVSQEKANEMLAEAKTLRANAHFMLLRVFGQFYDTSSQYGIIANTKVVDGFTNLKRNTVSATYDLIISDLEFAIEHASNSKKHFYVNKTFSEALLAKVNLYKGDFAKAATNAKNVIDNLGADFALQDSYSGIFAQGAESVEVLYAPFYKENTAEENIISVSSNTVRPSDYFKSITDPMVKDTIVKVPERDEYGIPIPGTSIDSVVVRHDPRYQFTFGAPTSNNNTNLYNKYPTLSSSYYYLRVAEVYLIYAEALVRSNGSTDGALDALNTVRQRAYENITIPYYNGVKAPLVTFTTKATLLEDIRKEKMIELCIENAESWFDLVRYDRLGDLSASTFKSGINNQNKLIFPIALSTLSNNPNFGPQNPGY